MSQEKVDRYKEQKANRKQIMAKERRNRTFGKLVFTLIIAAIIVWAAYSIHSLVVANTEPSRTYINTTALTDYISGLNPDTEY